VFKTKRMRTSIYKLLSGIIIFAVFLVLHSCDSGPKPDKIVKMTLGFDAFVDSDQSVYFRGYEAFYPGCERTTKRYYGNRRRNKSII